MQTSKNSFLSSILPIFSIDNSLDLNKATIQLEQFIKTETIPISFKLNLLKNLIKVLNKQLVQLENNLTNNLNAMHDKTRLSINNVINNTISNINDYNETIMSEPAQFLDTNSALDMFEDYDNKSELLSNNTEIFSSKNFFGNKKRKILLDKICEIKNFSSKIKNVTDILINNNTNINNNVSNINNNINIFGGFKINKAVMRNEKSEIENVENFNDSFNTFEDENSFQTHNESNKEIEYEKIFDADSKEIKANKFFNIVMLCNEGNINAMQEEEYGEIKIIKK